MEDDTLNSILNLLQNSNRNNTQSTQTNSTPNLNNDIQNILIKFLLSGGLNQILNFNNNQAQTTQQPQEKPRTIDLKNYQRLDWTSILSSTTSTTTAWTCSVIIFSEILSSICDWIKRRIGRTP